MRSSFHSSEATPSPLDPVTENARHFMLRLDTDLSMHVNAVDATCGLTAQEEPALHRDARTRSCQVEIPVREYPDDFTWSFSKEGVLARCERQYGLQYVLSKGGWKESAPADVREAYRLKQLSTLPTEVGSAVHRRAAECARAVIDGLEIPPLAVLIDRSRAELNALALSSRNLDAFVQNPKRQQMLREVYYDAGATLRLDLVERASARMRTALATLHASSLWAELRAIPNPRESILLPEPYHRFDYEGRHVFAAPDLVFRRPARKGAAGGEWTIVDFKVASMPNLGDTSQVAVYGLAVVVGFGWPLVTGCAGRVINLLLDETDAFGLTADDLVDAGRRIIHGTERLWARLMDDAGAPRALTRADFAPTEHLDRCRQCVFAAACHPGAAAALKHRRTAA